MGSVRHVGQRWTGRRLAERTDVLCCGMPSRHQRDVLVRARTADGPAVPANLYVLAVGVSRYHRGELKLQYPAKDARDLGMVFQKQEGHLFEKVRTTVLVDKDATVARIKAGLNWLIKQTTDNDMAIVMLAGHGINDARIGYCFLSVDYDPDPEQLLSTAVTEGELRDLLTRISGKRLFIIDTCHAGQLYAGQRRYRNVPHLGRFIRELQVARPTLVSLLASTGDQLAAESSDWGNGAFTKALIEGLKGSADRSGRGVVYVTPLYSYVCERVKELTSGDQTPTISMPDGVLLDFPLAITEVEMARQQAAAELAREQAEQLACKEADELAQRQAAEEIIRSHPGSQAQSQGLVGAHAMNQHPVVQELASTKPAPTVQQIPQSPTPPAKTRIQAALGTSRRLTKWVVETDWMESIKHARSFMVNLFRKRSTTVVLTSSAILLFSISIAAYYSKHISRSRNKYRPKLVEISINQGSIRGQEPVVSAPRWPSLRQDKMTNVEEKVVERTERPAVDTGRMPPAEETPASLPSPEAFYSSAPSDSRELLDELKSNLSVIVKHLRGPFLMSATEITRSQYRNVLGEDPASLNAAGQTCSRYGLGNELPVSCVDLHDAVRYANKLSEIDGLAPCYKISDTRIKQLDIASCTGYRIPSDIEWEYAAAGGENKYLYAGSNDLKDIAWYNNNASRVLHDVATKSPNQLGLYDMNGNVWEWTWVAPEAPMPFDGTSAYYLGGSIIDGAQKMLISRRDAISPKTKTPLLGFRIVRSWKPSWSDWLSRAL